MSFSNLISQDTYTGSASSYTIDFPVLLTTDVVVQLTDVNGNVTTLANGTDYTVSLLSDFTGGTVTLSAAVLATVVSTTKVTISRLLPLTQTTSLTTGGKQPAKTLESVYDRIVMMVQQLQRQINKTVRGSDASADLTPYPTTPTTGIWLLSVVNGAFSWILQSTASLGTGSVIPASLTTATGTPWSFAALINAAAAAFSGNVTVGGTLGVTGTLTSTAVTDGSGAGTGKVGETVLYTAPSKTTINAGVVTAVASYSLPAGDWDVWGRVTLSTNGTTLVATSPVCAYLYTNGTLQEGTTYHVPAVTVSTTLSLPLAAVFVKSSSATTVELKAQIYFSSGDMNAALYGGTGLIYARRRR